jgi:hypothetical protein
MPSIYDEDRFYADLQEDRIIWIYHNPDAVSRDQFVCNHFDIDLLKKAVKECGGDASRVFDYLAEHCRQYLHDVGDGSYEYVKRLFESDPNAIDAVGSTIQRLELLFEAKEKINEYCKSEFDSPADFSDLRKIGLAYTTTPDGKHEIQVYANLLEYKTETCLDCEVVVEQESRTLDEYVYSQLSHLDFDELTDIPDFVMDEINGTGLHRPDLKFMQYSAWGTTYDTCVEVGSYLCGGGLYLSLQDRCEDGLEPFADITVNLPEYRPAADCAFVDTNNLGQAEQLIAEYKLGRPTGRFARSGYCTYPEYRFDMEKVREYCINPQDIKIPDKTKTERSDAR